MQVDILRVLTKFNNLINNNNTYANIVRWADLKTIYLYNIFKNIQITEENFIFSKSYLQGYYFKADGTGVQ